MVPGKPLKVEKFHLGCFHFGWYCQRCSVNRNLIDSCHRKFTLKVRVSHFLMSRNKLQWFPSSMLIFGQNSCFLVTHPLWNSTTVMTIECMNINGVEKRKNAAWLRHHRERIIALLFFDFIPHFNEFLCKTFGETSKLLFSDLAKDDAKVGLISKNISKKGAKSLTN